MENLLHHKKVLKSFEKEQIKRPTWIKLEILIPEFLEFANIVAIYNGKGEKSSLQNDRGVFLVNLLRSILIKLVYKDKYPTVDESMSDSQIGARKKKNIHNHIFILNGIINEAVNKGKFKEQSCSKNSIWCDIKGKY